MATKQKQIPDKVADRRKRKRQSMMMLQHMQRTIGRQDKIMADKVKSKSKKKKKKKQMTQQQTKESGALSSR